MSLFPKIKTIGTISPVAGDVAHQYERYPYPRVSLFATPMAHGTQTLTYEYGEQLRSGHARPHDRSTRILVAGSGAFEPLVVARAHPCAEIVAVDLSRANLNRLRRHAFFSGLASRLNFVQADLHHDLGRELGLFDYVISTGVVHHTPAPATMLQQLAALLKPNGCLRLMTYAKQSRLWVYELRRYFESSEIDPKAPLRRQCRARIKTLPTRHPLRSTYECYSDARFESGLVDGFFHACDNPITIPTLREFCERADLQLVGFGHAKHSQPDGFIESLRFHSAPDWLVKKFETLDRWEQLAFLDDCAELTVNPVLWLAKEPRNAAPRDSAPTASEKPDPEPSLLEKLADGRERFSPIRARQLEGLRNALSIFTRDERAPAIATLARALEPRVSIRGDELPWLSSGDLLRDLIQRGFTPAQMARVIESFPPPSDEFDRDAGLEWFLSARTSL